MSQLIKCPNCGQQFTIDESNYQSIVKQIRDHEFQNEVASKIGSEVALATKEKETEYLEKFNDQNAKYEKLRSDANAKYMEQKTKNEALQQQLDLMQQNLDNAINASVSEAVNAKDQEIANLKAQYANLQNQTTQQLGAKDTEIAKITSDYENAERAKANEISLKVNEAVKVKEEEFAKLQAELNNVKSEKEKEILELNNNLEKERIQAEANTASLKQSYELQLKAKDEQVEFYKDFKARQSTKAIGESLEQYCHNEFDKIRAAAFPEAYFEKDNVVSASGSKGDFIFKDFRDGVEYVSIMFEMKNEADTTASKHKNEDFFKELDKDRNEKGCEYAVLVSMLESDNELYNQGIVNVSHKYPKMYVVRPQFFIPIITLIRDGALNSVEAKKELMTMKTKDIDLSNFEENMRKFQKEFGGNYERASKYFENAIADIDKSIKSLEKIKKDLTTTDNQMRLANDKAQDLSVKKLTKNAPSIREKIESYRKEDPKKVETTEEEESSEVENTEE